MTDLELAAPLAAALAAKGYDNLTSVQTAVLAPELAGRDLLVSAQTGSGKTVAFGLALAGELLDGDLLPPAVLPQALAIAPTRELALQVARELGWLYAQAGGEQGARIATCVGGMDYRTERRALERGAQIVVGTPGRLRDHIERGSLDLSALRACVLDEADEMLDLGFREDLEFILGTAPEDRRTLMFSATVPPAIEALARDFQRDAARVVAGGEARQHGDISYQALTVAPRDRDGAIFNLLRFHDARTAIVFCKTRVNVNHLLARMGNRGFRVVALSGELSQQERSHALQALRDGRARICIATDVAARGIDLPGLDLVIHADLPTNAETLLHRSGRTGRAGSKGISALIVPAGDYKRAQRLLHHAKVEAEWGNPPTADDVRGRDDERMLAEPALAEPAGEDAAIAQTLIERFGAEQVAAAFVRQWREGRPAPEEISEGAPPVPAARAPRAASDFGPSRWFQLSVGHSGRAEARWLLPKICEAGGITRDAIGAIRVRQDDSYVQIAADAAPRFGAGVEIEPGLTMLPFDGEPEFGPRPRRDDARPAGRFGAKTGGKFAGKPGRKGAERSYDRAEERGAAPSPRRGGWSPDDGAILSDAPRPRRAAAADGAESGAPASARPAAKFAKSGKPAAKPYGKAGAKPAAKGKPARPAKPPRRER